jgi:hypothetical protein
MNTKSIKDKVMNTLREYTLPAMIISGTAVLGVGITAGRNRICNHRTQILPEFTIVSRPQGIFGHTDYIKHADGTQELNHYSGLGLRMGRMTSYQDNDGNDIINTIRENCSEFQAHRIIHFYQAEKDYNAHKKEFDDATKELSEFKQKYVK